MTFDPAQPRDEHGRWTHAGGVYGKLTANDILNGPQVAPQGSRTNPDIAAILNKRGQAALKELGVKGGVIPTPAGKKAESNREHDNIVSSAIASEIEDELRRGGRSSENWYTGKVDEAMKIAGLMHPEMVSNPAAKFAYTLALAVTSQGETVPTNTRLADKVYESFEKDGKFPTDIQSQAQDQMNGSFEKANHLIESLGVAGTVKFLNQEFTVGELEKQGYKVSGESKGTQVYGSAIFGPKVGQGFYQNLNGNYSPLTADMWFMRGWGRLTGTLVGTVDTTKPQARFEAALKKDGEKIPTTKAGWMAKANEITSATDRKFDEARKSGTTGKVKKAEVEYAAERYREAVEGIKDMPSSGGQRNHLRDVFAQAQQKLADAGHNMTIADMQATWWYPEKRLYQKMGSRSGERINTDYATELRAYAKTKGFTDEQIDKAVKS